MEVRTKRDTREKKDRNWIIVQQRLADPKRWSWRELGEYHKIHWTTAESVYRRYTKKYGVGKLSTGE